MKYTWQREKNNLSILSFKKKKESKETSVEMTKMQMPGFEHTDASFKGHRYNDWANSIYINSQLL